MVLHGMELLKEHTESESRFEGWLGPLDKVLDSRGKMGSLVGASKDYFKYTGISENPEEHLIEYGVRLWDKEHDQVNDANHGILAGQHAFDQCIGGSRSSG